MKRLTTDTPKNNLESALNLFYAKDGEAWVLRGGSEPNYVDVTLFDYIRSAIPNVLGPLVSNLSDDELSEVLSENWLFDGNSTVEGLIATLYTAAWAFAELRERLKMYEDREQEVRRWIPVSERLPENGQKVVFFNYGADAVYAGKFNYVGKRGTVWFRAGKTSYPGSCWMPLPEPPKEGAK